MDRTILHCDCNGFFASVECVMNPELKKVPMAVGGDEESRHGIILAKNELAKKYNIQTAETIWQARRKCPQLVVVPPHRDEYSRYSKMVNDIYKRYTDLIEPFGIDESWLDVTGSKRLFGDGKSIADRLRHEVYDELGLTISVGVSFNKIFAKLGSDYKKPNATTVIDKVNYKNILYPLPVSAMLYVGKSTLKKLEMMNIKTIGELAMADKSVLIKHLGKLGGMVYEYANGLDDSPVESVYEKRDVKSIGNGTTFKRDLITEYEIYKGVLELSQSVAYRMRKQGVKCSTVQVVIKNPEFKNISRQTQLSQPTFLSREIANTAMDIIKKSWNMGKPIRMITVTGTNLVFADEAFSQLSLFDVDDSEKREKQEKLETTIDALKDRFGDSFVSMGIQNKNTHSKDEK